MARDLDVTLLSKDVTVASYREVLIAQCRAETPASAAKPFRATRDKILRNHSSFVFFAVVEPTSSPPDQAARKAFAEYFEESSEAIAGVVFAHKVEGFRGAMIRTVVSGLLDLMPRKRFAFPRHVVSNVAEAARLARQCASGVDPNALVAAYDALAAMNPGA